MFRKVFFWSHLVVGLSVGVIVFIMSATGVLLTYEKQIIEWNDSRHSVLPLDGEQRLSTDQVLSILREKHPDENHIYIHWVNETGRAIALADIGRIDMLRGNYLQAIKPLEESLELFNN